MLPLEWEIPGPLRARVGARTAGRQRALAAEGHLVLVLHRAPGPDDNERSAAFFWRAPDGRWQSTPDAGGLAALRRHLHEYAALEDRLEAHQREHQRALLAILLLSACGDQASEAPHPKLDLTDWHVAGDEDGLSLGWKPIDGPVPRNEEFELGVVVLDQGRGLAGVQLDVRGWMPDHGHGLVTTPRVVDEGSGAYRVEGLLLHMRGDWQLIFDVTRGTDKQSFTFDVAL